MMVLINPALRDLTHFIPFSKGNHMELNYRANLECNSLFKAINSHTPALSDWCHSFNTLMIECAECTLGKG
jgi:hypothetical protein